jgi:general stress protein YciG
MSNKRQRGFAAMDPEKQRAIASKGGKAAHAKGTAHRFTTEEASEAGRKGGKAAHARGTAHRFTAEEASKAGRKGGSSRSASAQQHRNQPHERGEPSNGAGHVRSAESVSSGIAHGPGTDEESSRQNEQTSARRPVPSNQLPMAVQHAGT